MATVLSHARFPSGIRSATTVNPTVPRTLQYPTFPAWGLLDRAARRAGDRAGCVYFGKSLTFSELNEAAKRMASALRKVGVKHGDRVGLLLPNVPEYVIGINAIWRAGGIAVSISPLMVQSEVESHLKTTGCRVVITLDMLSHLLSGSAEIDHRFLVSLRPHLGAIQQLGYLLVRHHRTGSWAMNSGKSTSWFWEALHAEEPLRAHRFIDTENEPAYILATGGTTAQPKAVTLSHRNLVANAWQQMHWAGGELGTEKLMGVLPFFHSYGLSTTVLGGSAMAATVVLYHRFNTRRVIQLMQQHRPTVFHAVPAMLAAMNEQFRRRSPNIEGLKWVISGGAALSTDVGREFADHTGALVVEGYGLSEASPVTHVGPLNEHAQFGTIGLPLPDTDVRIVDQNDGTTLLARGEIGELAVRGPQVMLGYWNNQKATDLAIQNGWLKTGDLARVNEDGLYEIKERKKDLIITSGYNVYPREVEQKLCECDGVQDAAVVGIADQQRGEIVKAFVVLKSGFAWDVERLDRFCRQHLAAHKRPRVFEHCEGDLPRNFLGKVLRRHLREA